MDRPRAAALFIGHGSPMNALQVNPWSTVWRNLGQTLPRPRAILAISAHWYGRGLTVTADVAPRTIHDFAGFPPALYAVRYPAPGAPDLARRVTALLQPREVEQSSDWGLDHGTWSVLVHLYPEADVPVVQLRIDATEAPAFHYALGRTLAVLRDEGVLIFGSGNVVHNLARIVWDDKAPPYDWAETFEARVRDALLAGDHASLINYATGDVAARLSVPTPDHFLPLLYVLGAQAPGESAQLPQSGLAFGSISMLSVIVG